VPTEASASAVEPRRTPPTKNPPRRPPTRREATRGDGPVGREGGRARGVEARAPGRAGEARIPEARAGARARGGGMDEGGGGGDPKVLFRAIGSDDSPRPGNRRGARVRSALLTRWDCGGLFAAGPRVSQALNPRRASLPSPGSVARCAGRERPRRRIARRVVARGPRQSARARLAAGLALAAREGSPPDPPTRRAGPTVDSPKPRGYARPHPRRTARPLASPHRAASCPRRREEKDEYVSCGI